MSPQNIVDSGAKPPIGPKKSSNFSENFDKQLDNDTTIEKISRKVNSYNVNLENKTLKEKIASYLIGMSILCGVGVASLGIILSFYVSYSQLQKEFVQTKIEQQNERIKKLEQNQNPFLQLIR